MEDKELVARLEDVWAFVESAREWQAEKVWIHGDLHARNVVVNEEGGLAGVIDFGDVCAGDPAVDYGAAWTMFDARGVRQLREAVECDLDTWSRATAWALYFGMMYVLGCGGNQKLRSIGIGVLRCVVDVAVEC